MTRIFTEGFEFGVFNGFVITAGTPSIVTSPVRSGSYCINASATSMYRDILSTNEIYFRFGYNTNNNNSAHQRFQWLNGATLLGHIRLEGQHFTAYTSGSTLVSTGSLFIPLNTWFLLEAYIKIDNSVGRIVVKIDGITDIDFTGDTQPASLTTISRIGLAMPGGIENHYLDDIAINNTVGETDSGWCGDGHIVLLKPVMDGDTLQLIPSSGSSHWSLVDETPPNTTDYVSGSVVGEYDLYNLTDFSVANASVKRIWGESRSLDTVAEGGTVSIGIKVSGEGEDWGTDSPVLTTYTRVLGKEYRATPSGSTVWTSDNLNNLQVGIKTRT